MKTRNSHDLLQLHVGREALAYRQCLYRENKALFVSVDLIGEKNQEKKEEIWLSPMTKAPTPTEMSKGQSDNTNNVTKMFD